MIARTVDGCYAQALFDAARDSQVDEQVDQDLAVLAGQLADNEEFRRLLLGRALSINEKKDLLAKAFVSFQQITLNCLYLVVDKGREQWLPRIIDSFHAIFCEAHGILVAELITYQPADDDLKKRLAAFLADKYGRNVEFTCRTDSSLLGGAVIKTGDQVFDLSLAKQFALIRRQLLEA